MEKGYRKSAMAFCYFGGKCAVRLGIPAGSAVKSKLREEKR